MLAKASVPSTFAAAERSRAVWSTASGRRTASSTTGRPQSVGVRRLDGPLLGADQAAELLSVKANWFEEVW
jgi:hypothetical protein